jgi:YfiH family protein
MARNALELIEPDWPAPDCVAAASTTRVGGTSAGPYAELNLGTHVGDRPESVAANRNRLADALGLPGEPRWLNQVHGNVIVDAGAAMDTPSADGSMTSRTDIVCVVQTADCLPVLLCDTGGNHVAAVHGGWRGLVSGILEAALSAFTARGVGPAEILCWLGPAIGPSAYEVGDQVAEALRGQSGFNSMTPAPNGHWHLNLYDLARTRLAAAGVDRFFGGDYCTYTDADRFFSYRRDGTCGRLATLIWRRH